MPLYYPVRLAQKRESYAAPSGASISGMVGSATTLDASIPRFVTDRNSGKRKSGPSSDRYKEAKGGETQRVGDARRPPQIWRNGEKGTSTHLRKRVASFKWPLLLLSGTALSAPNCLHCPCGLCQNPSNIFITRTLVSRLSRLRHPAATYNFVPQLQEAGQLKYSGTNPRHSAAYSASAFAARLFLTCSAELCS